MQTRVKWLEERSFVAHTGSSHTVCMDGSPEFGGRNLAARPMEMVLVGLGGCSGFDVIAMLEKSRELPAAFEVRIDAKRADAVPAIFESVHLVFSFLGDSLNEKAITRAVSLSMEKYCSVTKMLEATVEITWEVELNP